MADSNPLFTSFTKDGKQELFADPQHFTGANNEGRARSGEKNPFPTADYGMTAGGVWVPKKVADDGSTLTQLTGSMVELYLFSDIIVSSGSFAFSYDETVMKSFEYNEIRFNLIWESDTDWEISYRPRTNTSTRQIGESTKIIGSTFSGKGVLEKEINSARYSFDLKNNGVSDVKLIQCQILGVV